MTFTRALSTNNYGNSKFIVGTDTANTTHSTLAGAMAVASSGDTIYLRDSVTEDVTLTPGVSIVSFPGNEQTGNVSITGKLTMTGAGLCSISGIRLITNSDYCIVVSGSAASQLRLKDCYIEVADNDAISHTSSDSSSFIELIHCNGAVTTTGITYHVSTSAGVMRYVNSFMRNTGVSTTASSVSTGTVRFLNSSFQVPQSTSSTGFITAQNSSLIIPTGTNATCVTTAGTGTSNFKSCSFESGTSSAISAGSGTTVLLNLCTVLSTNATALTGLGTISLAGVSFGNSSDIDPTAQGALVTRPGTIRSDTMPAFYAYLATGDTNTTGDTTTFTVGSATALTEIFDQGSDFNTNGTFTAPYTGRYFLHGGINVSNLSSGHTNGLYQIVTSNRTANFNAISPYTCRATITAVTIVNGTFLSDMDSADTATLTVSIAGSTKTVTIGGGSPNTQFSGWMVC